MGITGDFFIGARIPDETLTAVMARAIGVHPAVVGIYTMGMGNVPQTDVTLIVVEKYETGDYAGQYIGSLDDAIEERFDAILSTLSQMLHTPILYGAGLDDPDIMNLSLPDGSVHHVLVEQEEDGSIVNTPEMRQLIEHAQSVTRPIRAA